MNKTLYKANIKANWGIWMFISLMMLMYMSIAITMFNPESAEAIEGMLKFMPEGMVKAFGFSNLGTDLTGYLSNYLYGFIFITFPVIYTVLVSNKLIAKHVDSGSMAYLLTTPNTRSRIASTQAIYLISSIAAIFTFNVTIGIILSESMFKGLLDINKFIALNWITFLAIVAVGGVGFFFSCLFNDTKNSLAFGGGIPILFLVIKMVTGISDSLDWLKYFTVYSFVNIEEILTSNTYVIVSSLILLGISAVLYYAAITIFNRKSLSI